MENYVVCQNTENGLVRLHQFTEDWKALRWIWETTMHHLNESKEAPSELINQMNFIYMCRQLPAWKQFWVEHPEINVLHLNIYPDHVLNGQLEIQ